MRLLKDRIIDFLSFPNAVVVSSPKDDGTHRSTTAFVKRLESNYDKSPGKVEDVLVHPVIQSSMAIMEAQIAVRKQHSKQIEMKECRKEFSRHSI